MDIYISEWNDLFLTLNVINYHIILITMENTVIITTKNVSYHRRLQQGIQESGIATF